MKKCWTVWFLIMKNVSLKSKILTLSSQLDQAGDLWSNSHLLNMEMSPYNVRYPIILPRMHDVTNTIVKQHHVDTHYYPRNTGLCRLTELFKNMSLHGWNTRRRKAKTASQVMAPVVSPTVNIRELLHCLFTLQFICGTTHHGAEAR